MTISKNNPRAARSTVALKREINFLVFIICNVFYK